MILIPIQATDATPKTIDLLTDSGNKFASIDKAKNIRIYGEDMTITIEEAKFMLDISDNFDSIFKSIKNATS